MTPKPQATLDEILEDNNILAGTDAKLTEIGYEVLGENIQSAKQQIQAHYLAEVLDIAHKAELQCDEADEMLAIICKLAKERFK